MKLSKTVWQTYKDNPSDAEIPSHQLMMRAGLLHKGGSGLYNYLPFTLRILDKVQKIIREEMDAIDCQEILMTVVTPGELWQESGRWDKMGDLMLKFKDKNKKDLCISPTNEEAVVDIFRNLVKSYKQLPTTFYQINTKFRDEIRPRYGLMRGREFTMKDAYSFHSNKQCLDQFYDKMYTAYENVVKRLGLKYIAVEADGGAMASSDSKTHEFQIIADSGEDTLICSIDGKYAANIEKAITKRKHGQFKFHDAPITEVATPGMQSIESVANFLNVSEDQCLKVLAYKIVKEDKEFCSLLVLLGDDNINEIKIAAHFKADHVKLATDNELQKWGLVKGYIGPKGHNTDVQLVIDTAIDLNASYITGANKSETHYKNFVPKRDLNDIHCADLRLAKAGDLTMDNVEVVIKKGIEVGHIFQLGDKYTKALKVTVLNEQGKEATPLMGCYGIGVTRIIAATIEQNHDEKGIVWPYAMAPFHIHLISIFKDEAFAAKAEELYKTLKNWGYEVLYDDRPKIGPGFKFKDADLLGIPIRVVIGERDFNAEGTLEVVLRKTGIMNKVAEKDLNQHISSLVKTL